MKIINEFRPQKKSNKKISQSPVWSVVWRFLLFCAIIDGGIYFYFHQIKNITVSEGIRNIRVAIHGNGGKSRRDTGNAIVSIPSKRKIVSEEIGVPKESVSTENLSTVVTPKTNKLSSSNRNEGLYKIYCWEDENGNRHFSNTGYPTFGKFTIIRFE